MISHTRAVGISGLQSVVVVLVIFASSICYAQSREEDLSGLFPVVFNLATRARVSANATCGEKKPEIFCKLVQHVELTPNENLHCDICDLRSTNPEQRHSIRNAVDGSERWWQSPSLANGPEYNEVSITLDLGQIYQIAYIIVKAANSPRPGNWVLERSLDGKNYLPWQYFAMGDQECRNFYGIEPTIGVPTSLKDDQVICTSRYSALNPLENGEIFVSLVNGRPGVFQPSPVLLEFTSAKFIRLRFQKIRTLHAELMTFRGLDSKMRDPSVTRRYYYSIKDISIGGQCICYGHAAFCRRHMTEQDRLQCQCLHNTAGDNCEFCMPNFNQKPWQVGGIQNIGCEECNCNQKSNECVYNATVDAKGLSLNKDGKYEGGGVCLNCGEYTTGINCEKCLEGYFRRPGMTSEMSRSCQRCSCVETATATSQCVPDDSLTSQGLRAGDCICKEGYEGRSCDRCKFGYHGFPRCRPCQCNATGAVDPEACDQPCTCKDNVAGIQCDRCKPGHFNLRKEDALGCTECFCFGVSRSCDSVAWGLSKVTDNNGWVLSTLKPGGLTLLPRFFDKWLEAKTYLLKIDHVDPRSYSQDDIHYWNAPMTYLGNRLSSYGGNLEFTLRYVLDDRVRNQYHLREPNVVLEGSNISVTTDKEYLREVRENVVSIPLREDAWYHLTDGQPATREDLMKVLHSLERLLIRATYHTAQDTVYLKDVKLDAASPLVMNGSSLPSVEQCRCPTGHAGLSCESCSPGWRRVNNQLFRGRCEKCDCSNHASECDPYTGACLDCKHSTTGVKCHVCLPGFYGDPRRGTPDDCKPCACPLVSGTNFFAERCVARPTQADKDAYECLNCREGYTGGRCQECAPGYYGDPTLPGGSCRRCSCGGNLDKSVIDNCDKKTGVCNRCTNNTEGEYCERCRRGYYGSAVNGDCRPCQCSDRGSTSSECNPRIGQCTCRGLYAGRKCDRCQAGYGDVNSGCVPCDCGREGSISTQCDPTSGQCQCQPGVDGTKCNKCKDGFHGFSRSGCKACNCYSRGTNNSIDCNPKSGRCICNDGVSGRKCNSCKVRHFGLMSGKGCSPCDCDRVGSREMQCEPNSGKCSCRPGIGGRRCDQCLPEYFGFSKNGCQRCKPCTRKGHVCDPITGKCDCPPNTEGPNCEKCIKNCWGHNKDKGCKQWNKKTLGKRKNSKRRKERRRRRERRLKRKNKGKRRKNKRRKLSKLRKRKPCNCNMQGSEAEQCDVVTGKCPCVKGHQGLYCDSCLPGYFIAASCQSCGCNSTGVIEDTCENDVCECDGIGQCFCKENVNGKQCDQCRPGTFSLDKMNPKGCTECYCFFRARSCRQAPFLWTTMDIPSQVVNLVEDEMDGVPVVEEYGFLVINGTNVFVPDATSIKPIFWKLPPVLPSDLILSYGGKLSFIHYFEGTSNPPLIPAPLVVLVGNGFVIQTGSINLEPTNALQFNIPLHEDAWTLPNKAKPIDRRVMMVVLQNVEAILVRATQDGKATYAEIGPITLQTAVPSGPNVTSTEPALGVELCDCPKRYSGESCQNPGEGFHKVLPTNPDNSQGAPETVIGHVRRCQCFGHSKGCDPKTGVCEDCQHNTTGDKCESCADGFYGVATMGGPDDCKPCACPLEVPSNNFSPTCAGGKKGMMCTDCEEGYIGLKCEKCAPGYYGDSEKEGDTCKPCNCNPDGSISDTCDPSTGQCPCLTGISGRSCDQCTDTDAGVVAGKCVSCYTGCTGILLDELANMTVPTSVGNVSLNNAQFPWDKLYKNEKEANELRDKLVALESAGVKGLDNYKDTVDRFNDLADKLLSRVRKTDPEACKTKDDAADMLKQATELEKEVNKTYTDIMDMIQGLDELVERLLYNQSGVNMTEALAKAKKLLEDIENRDFTEKYKATREENMLAEALSDDITVLTDANFNSSDVKALLDDLNNRLGDLANQTNATDAIAKEALDKIAELRDLLTRLKSIRDEIVKVQKDALDFIDEAKTILEKAEENLLVTQGENGILNIALDELTKRIQNYNDSKTKLNEDLEKAINHVMDLISRAEELEKLFSKTRNISEDAVKAAKAYKSIVDAIKEANKSANNALKNAKESVDIAKVSDLEKEVQAMINKSKEQLKESNDLLKNASGLAIHLTEVNKNLTEAENSHKKVKDTVEEMKDKLKLLPSDLTSVLKAINDTNKNTMETIDEALNLVDKFNNTMGEKVKELKGFDITGFNFDIGSEISRAKDGKDDSKKMADMEKEVEDKAQAAIRKTSRLSYDLDRLKQKIQEARSRVNDMKLSLEADGQCHRSYRSPMDPSSTNEIRLGFKLNGSTSDMLMVLLQQSPKDGGQEFLAAEIKDQKVKFTWNSGKGHGSVSHPQMLEPQKWYKVVARRVGSVGQLKVWNMDESTEKKASQEVATMGAGCSLMNLNEGSSIMLAGSSDLSPIPTGITRNNFVGCMGDVHLDTNRIGVFNFKTNEPDHCGACMEIPQVQLGSSTLNIFSGYGFAQFAVQQYNSKRTTVELEFKTFYEDSQIFFVGNPNPKTGDFCSIVLRGGHVAVHFNMGGLSFAQGQTKHIYNNNKWTTVLFDRRGLKAVLKVNTERISMRAPGPAFGLELSGAPMFFGGLPSKFKVDHFKNLKKTKFFYGCMKIQNFGTLTPDADTSTLVNVEASSSCRENGIHNVAFGGDGYLIFQNNNIKFSEMKNDISLTFITNQEDSVLLIARDPAGQNYYSISLMNGGLETRIKSDTTAPVIIKSPEKFNDGKMHCVSLIKNGKNTELIVDDTSLGSAESRDITGLTDLYLGGLPVDAGDITPTNNKLDGCISDVIANGILLSMSDAKQYKRADVGRCKYTDSYPPAQLADLRALETLPPPTVPPTPPPQTTTSLPDSTTPPSCAAVGSLESEAEAKSVGNEASFYAEIYGVKRGELKRNLKLSVDFRTFYPNGVFGYLLNDAKDTYLGIQLKDGKVQVKYNYEAKPVQIDFANTVNDGQWHMMTVEKNLKEITIQVDKEPAQTKRIARKLDIEMPLYLGGPTKAEVFINNSIDLVTHGIRGCIRNFQLVGKDINMDDHKVVMDVSTCYKTVEQGAAFGGDSWGMISEKFEIMPQYSMLLEFRSTKQDGILLSSSSVDGKSGLVLELHEGKIKLTIVQDGTKTTVETPNVNLYEYCGKNWHTLDAALDTDKLTISLDNGNEESVNVPNGIQQVNTDSPLFIGGFHSSFTQKASQSGTMFNGCIRSVVLDKKPIDWYDDIVRSTNIRRTACPV